MGPPSVTTPVCLACLAPLRLASDPPGEADARRTHVPCPQCGAPLCDQCAASPGVTGVTCHGAECQIIREAGASIELGDLSRTHILYAAILPLRMWLTRIQRPEVWRRLNSLQCDTSEAHRQKPIWAEVADYVQNTLGVKDMSLEDIVRLSGIKVFRRTMTDDIYEVLFITHS